MEEKSSAMESLFEKLQAYCTTSFELVKLKAVNKTANAVSATISYSIVMLFLFMFVLFASVGAALWIGDLLDKTYYGFLCVAGFYGVVGFILYLARNIWIKKRVNNSIITYVLN